MKIPLSIIICDATPQKQLQKRFEPKVFRQMMAKKQKIITIETRQQIFIRSRRQPLVVWCEACGMNTLMFVPEQAAALCGTTERKLFRQIENGELHFIETKNGQLFVCSNSLPQKN
jgi:hypothetical protein